MAKIYGVRWLWSCLRGKGRPVRQGAIRPHKDVWWNFNQNAAKNFWSVSSQTWAPVNFRKFTFLQENKCEKSRPEANVKFGNYREMVVTWARMVALALGRSNLNELFWMNINWTLSEEEGSHQLEWTDRWWCHQWARQCGPVKGSHVGTARPCVHGGIYPGGRV